MFFLYVFCFISLAFWGLCAWVVGLGCFGMFIMMIVVFCSLCYYFELFRFVGFGLLVLGVDLRHSWVWILGGLRFFGVFE